MGRCSFEAASATSQCTKHQLPLKQSKRGRYYKSWANISSVPSSAVCATCLRERLAKLICEECGGIINTARDPIIASTDDTRGNKCVCNHDGHRNDQHRLSAGQLDVQAGHDHDRVKSPAVKDISTGNRSIASLIENDRLEAAAAAAGNPANGYSRPSASELMINTEAARFTRSQNNAAHDMDETRNTKEMNNTAVNYDRWKQHRLEESRGAQVGGLTKSKSMGAAAGFNDNLSGINNNYSSPSNMLGSCNSSRGGSGDGGGGGGGSRKRTSTLFWGKLFSGVGRPPPGALGKINFRRSRSVASSSSHRSSSPSSLADQYNYGPAAGSSMTSSLITNAASATSTRTATPLINPNINSTVLRIKDKYNPLHSDHGAAAGKTYNYSNWGKSSCASWLRHVAGALRPRTHLYSPHHVCRDGPINISTDHPPLQLHLLHADDDHGACGVGAAIHHANQSSNPVTPYTDHTLTNVKGTSGQHHANHSSDTLINRCIVPDTATTVISSNYSSPSSAPDSTSSSSLLSSPTDSGAAATSLERSGSLAGSNPASISSLILLATQENNYKSSANRAPSRAKSAAIRGLVSIPHHNLLSNRKKARAALSTMVSVAS